MTEDVAKIFTIAFFVNYVNCVVFKFENDKPSQTIEFEIFDKISAE